MSQSKRSSVVAGRGGKPHWVRQVALQAAGILGVGVLLGLAFNSSNPIGIRFSEAKTNPPAASASPTSLVAQETPPPFAPPVLLTPPPSPVVSASSEIVTPGVGQPPGAIAIPETGRQNPSATTWAATHPILAAGKCLLVDARPLPAFEVGHIPGAVSLPQTSTDDEVKKFRELQPTNTHLVVYCSSTSCSLSFKLAFRLANEFGYGKVEYMTGGYQEWQRETSLGDGSASSATGAATALASSVGSAVPPPVIMPDQSALAKFRPIGIAWKELASAYPKGTARLVDIRADSEIQAGPASGAIRMGLASSDQELADWVKKLGAESPLIVFCQNGGCLDAVKFGTRLRLAGFKQVRALDEGYRETPMFQTKTALF